VSVQNPLLVRGGREKNKSFFKVNAKSHVKKVKKKTIGCRYKAPASGIVTLREEEKKKIKVFLGSQYKIFSLLFFYSLNQLKIDKYVVIYRKI